MRGLSDKVAIVTGGGGAIGRAICARLATEGCIVGVFDRDRESAEDTEEHILELKGRATSAAVDITDYNSCTEAVTRLERQHGPVDILVNCAGYDRCIAFLESDPVFWDVIIDINLKGHLNMLHCVLKGMVEQGRGRVVTISSDAARVGSTGESVYAACKAGLIALTKTLAREMADKHINLNVVCPGPTDTPLLKSFNEGELGTKIYQALHRAIPFRRLGRPDDIVGAVAFLASEEAAFITGQVLSVSGGLTMVD
jgi:2-hydroxycyclohexanecarboxyl-CoA dehydrogenase